MNIQRKKKRVQKIISIVLIAALSCVCVMGDYIQTNRNSRKKTAKESVQESVQTSVTDSQQGNQLRSIEELEIAKTETGPARIQETLQEGYARLSAAYESGADFQEAADAFAALVSQSEKQIEKELDQTENGTVEHQEYREYILDSYRKLGNYAGKLKGAGSKKTMGKIREMMEPETPYVALGEDLPFGTVEESDIPTEPYTEPDTQNYGPRNTKYTKQELEPTNDTVINDKVREEFQDLESPLEIYQYVKNNYMPEFYYGSRKGAIGTYEQKAGNDYDIASLLVGVFRDRNIPARYARGEIEITAEQAMDWTAADDIETAQRQIAAMGIPVTGMVSEGKTVAVRMEHVWVEAYVPYTDYRGAGSQSGESLWIPLDPSFKKMSGLDGVELASLTDYVNNTDNYLTADTEMNGVNVGGLSTVVEGQDSAFVKYMLENGYGEATLAEAFGGKEIVSEDLGYLPLTLPYPVNRIMDTFNDIPKNLTDSITVSLAGNSALDMDFDGNASIEKRLYTPDLYGKRLVLAYAPATSADQEVLDRYGNLFQTSVYLLKLKPQLLVDGEVVAEGEPCNPGYLQKYTINIHSAAADKKDESIGNAVVAGGMYCIALDYGTISADDLQVSADQMESLKKTISETNIYMDETMGAMLHSVAKSYFGQIDLYNAVVAGQNNVTATRDLSVGIVGFKANVVYTFDRPAELNEGGIFLDIGHDVHSVVSNENDREAEKAYMLQSGIYASAMEHGVLEQVTGVESVSTIKVLAYAQENNIPIHSITKDNLSKETEFLTVSEQVKEEIAASVNSGKVVIIPEQEITINQWSGVGYMVLDPDTFACGYMISGGLAGGAMTAFEFLTAVALNVLYGLRVMLGCMLIIYAFPVLAPLFIVLACISAVYTGFSIGTHIGNFINTGDVRELQEGMVELATFCLLVGIGEKLGNLLKNSETIKKTAEEVTKAVKDSSGKVCFIAGTPVLTSLGLVPIESVAVGNLVQSFHPQTQEVSSKQVEETFMRESSELMHVSVGGERITTTPEHPFYVAQKGFVKAVKLRAGDVLYTVNGEYVIVEQVQHEILESPVKVYNFRVAENHTYFVGNVSVGVHNAECAEIGGLEQSGENDSGVASEIKSKFTELLNSDYYKRDPGYDCSEIAEDFLDAAENQGIIYRIEGKNGSINGFEYGDILDFDYHEVYSDGTYIYDPRYQNVPILKDDYFNALKEINPDGFDVFQIK